MNPDEKLRAFDFQGGQDIEMPPEIDKHNLVGLSESALVGLIEKDFNIPISQIEKVTTGFSSQVYRAVSNGEVVFIRINKDPDIFASETIGYKILESLDIPAPKVLGFKERLEGIEQPTIILSGVEGVAVNRAGLSPEDEDLVYEQMGNVLRKINTIPLEGFGALKVEGQELRGKLKNSKDYWVLLNGRFVRDSKILGENGLLSDREIEKLGEIYQELINLDFQNPTLLHLDFHGEHVFVKDSKISGVIDLGAIKAGDPRYDIAMSLMFQNAKQRKAFKKGYGDLANDPMVLKYLLTISAKKIAFRNKMKKKDGVARATKVFRETFQELYPV